MLKQCYRSPSSCLRYCKTRINFNFWVSFQELSSFPAHFQVLGQYKTNTKGFKLQQKKSCLKRITNRKNTPLEVQKKPNLLSDKNSPFGLGY